MTTLTMTLPNAPHRQILIRLGGVATGVVPVDADDNVLTSWTTRTNASGEASIVLPATADITPSDTYYIVTVDQTSPTSIYYLELPDTTTVDLSDDANWIAVPEPPVLFPHPSTGNAGDVVKVNGAGTRYELGAGSGGATDAGEVTVAAGTMPTTEEYYPPADDKLDSFLSSIDQGATYSVGVQIAQSAQIAEVQRLRGPASAIGTVLDDTIAYLKVGHDGTGTPGHDEGAFICDTDLEFPTAVDVRMWKRTVTTAGDNTYAEGLVRNADGLVGAVDNYEGLTVYQDADGKLRRFAEHIYTGQTVEQDPRALTTADNPDNPLLGAVDAERHTIEYTVNAGNGVEKIWVPAGENPDAITSDGIGWRVVHTVNHNHPESLKTATEMFHLGLSEHETHIYAVQMYDGIDGTLLVDLHASDATSATSVTCREGTVWTAAGTQGEIVNYQSASGGAVDSVNGDTGTVVLTAADVGAVATSRTLAGLDLTTNRTAAEMRAAIGNGEWAPTPLIAFTSWKDASHAPAPTQSNARWFAGFLNGDSTALNRWIEWYHWLDAGTWTLRAFGETGAALGTCTMTLTPTAGGSAITAGTLARWASSTTAAPAAADLTGITIPTSGLYVLRSEVTAGGNGVSTNAGQRWSGFQFIRTA